MLTVERVTVRYGRFEALTGLDWSVGTDEGTVTALLGPSGCGKSTLLRAIAGFEPVADGVIAWDGHSLVGTAPHRRDFGVVFQDGQLFPGRTVAQNLAYGLARRGVRGRAARERIDEMLTLVRLERMGDRPVEELSGGQAQRVALARALAPRPRLLLLDEPLAAVDSQLRETLAESIGEIVRATRTPTVLVTHDHREAALMADTASVMRSGRIVQTAATTRLWHRPVDDDAARFLGVRTIVDGLLADGVVRTALGDARVDDETSFSTLPAGPCRIGLRPEAVVVTAADDGPGIVEHAAALVSAWRVRVRIGDDVVEAVSAEPVAVGARVRSRLETGALAVIG